MDQSNPSDTQSTVRVSDAVEQKRRKGTLADWLRDAWTWILVDAHRWLIIAVLAAMVYVATILIGVFGPWSQQQDLLDGTSIANAYIELQPGILTVITIVLAINQLVLSPEIGPVSRQRRRLEDVMAHRIEAENIAQTTSPTEPAQFLATLTAATQSRARSLRNVALDTDDQELRRRIEEYASGVVEEADRIGDTLDDQQFGRIEMLGAAIHYDTTKDIHRLRQLQNEHGEALSPVQQKTFNDMSDALELFTISREYFRTLYVRSEFIRFSRAILYTGVPAVLVAHWSVGVIGPNVLPGATFGVENLLWFEAGTLTLAVLPALVLASYIARLVTLAETSIFIGPFMPGRQSQQDNP